MLVLRLRLMLMLRLRNKMRIKVLYWPLLNFIIMLNINRSLGLIWRWRYLMMMIRLWLRLKVMMRIWSLMPYRHRYISNNIDNGHRRRSNLRIDRVVYDLTIDRLLVSSWIWWDRLNKIFRWLVQSNSFRLLRNKVGSKVDGRKLLCVNLIIHILEIFIFLFGSHLIHFQYRLKDRRNLNVVVVCIVSDDRLCFLKPNLIIFIVLFSLIKINKFCLWFLTFVRVVYHHL